MRKNKKNYGGIRNPLNYKNAHFDYEVVEVGEEVKPKGTRKLMEVLVLIRRILFSSNLSVEAVGLRTNSLQRSLWTMH